MKVILLAGGLGTRIAENCQHKPKPMLEIGGMPILWHIMKEYSYYGFSEFIICAGYMQQVIKKWFSDYFIMRSDITFEYRNGSNEMLIHNSQCEPWKVTIVDTGMNTMTGGRIKRIRSYIGDETFMMTYGDGVSDVDIKQLLDFHRTYGKCATITAVSQQQQKGILDIAESEVRAFREKEEADSFIINAGYMVLEPVVFDYIEGDNTVFEKETLYLLAKEGELAAFIHNGFWQCMDTKHEMETLERLYSQGKAPWKKW